MMWNLTNNTAEKDGLNNTAEKDGITAPYITLVTSLTVIGVLTLTANIVLLITLLRFSSKYLKQSTRLFLIYKSLGHACQGLAIMARPHILHTQCVHFGRFSRTVLGIVVGGMFLLSLDSFITITKPYRHNFIMTPRMAKLSVFLFSLLLVVLLLISALVPAPLPKSLFLCTQNDSHIDPWVMLMMTLLCIFFVFMAMSLQAHNIWSLWKRSNTYPPTNPAIPLAFVSNSIEPINNQPQNTNKTKVTRLDRLQRLLTVWVISIFVCWMPSNIIVCTRAIMNICSIIETPVLAWVQPFFTVLPLIDGLLQPCLAVALSQELRSAMKKLFCCGESESGVSTASNNAGGGGGRNTGNNVGASGAGGVSYI